MGIDFGAILGGILGGVGNFGQQAGGAIEAQRQEALARDKLRQEQEYRAAQITLERDKINQAMQIHQDNQLGVQLPPEMGGGRQPKELLPFLFAKQADEAKRMDEAGKLSMARSAILNQPARPDVALPAEGSMYSEADTLPGKAATPKNEMLAALLGQSNADALLKQMYPEDSQKIGHAPPGSAIFDGAGKIIGMVPALPKEPKEQNTNTHIVQTAQGQVAITVDAQGREVARVRVGDLPPHAPREAPQPTASVTIDNLMREYQAIKRQNPNDPRLPELDQRIQGQRFTMVPPGGAPWSVASQTTGPQNPVQPTGGERSEMADLRATLTGVESLLKDVGANKDVLGNIASNPTGSIRRGLSDYVPGMTTPDEKKFLANLGTQVAELKRQLIGAAQTNPELKGLADSLPDKSQVDITVVPRLEALRDKLRRSLSERQAPFQGAGQAPATPKVIRYDAQGNRIP